ncbi:MAG: tetratricopeptide repeat protein, partial [Phycisphaerales bacterium]|nr:tetratricopeptide repeat protein [Phycisphaerales bacterium]
ASTTLIQLLDLDPPPTVRSQALYRLGVCRFRTESYADAATILDQYMTENPTSDLLASASLMTGESLLRTGAHREAATHLERVVERFPTDEGYPSALLRLGECLSVMQRWGRAHDIFARHRQSFPESPLWFQSQFGLGWALENQGRHDEAIEAYTDVVARHEGPTAARAQFQIGECLYAQKKLEEAARELLKVDILYAYPEWSAAALYEAGRVFLDLRKPAEARTQFTTVVESHPDTEWARLAQDQLERLGVRRPD